MRKVSVNNILCVQFDEQTKKVSLLLRVGDTVWVVDGLHSRPLTDQEMANKDHIPER